jgi:hypothetical protein
MQLVVVVVVLDVVAVAVLVAIGPRLDAGEDSVHETPATSARATINLAAAARSAILSSLRVVAMGHRRCFDAESIAMSCTASRLCRG